jgi:electron transfer flavoprotein beta subunit
MPFTIVVCIKQIIDPELPASQFKLDKASKRQLREGQNLVISAYDQNALEVALQLKEKAGGKVTAISLGEAGATSALKSALGMGADDAVLLSDPAFLECDQFGVAHVLGAGIKKLGAYDLVLCGCESGDWGDKMVGPLLAEELGAGCVTFATRIEGKDGMVILRRVVETGVERIEARPPLVASILSDETNTPRYPKLRDIMAAGKKQIPVWKAGDVPVDAGQVGAASRRVEVDDLFIPVRESTCEVIEGETAEEKADRLAQRLRELKLI